jgi:hypothetical protein
MAHIIAAAVTAGPTPALHAGITNRLAQYTLAETASASTTIAICNIPGGARVVGATLSVDHGDFSTGGTVSVQSTTGGNLNGNIIGSDTAGTVLVYDPDDAINTLRHTSSSLAVVRLSGGFGATGSATTIFSLSLSYVADQDPD